MKGYWTIWRVVAWLVFLVLLVAYAQLAFRHDSSFFTVWWMPYGVARQILKFTYYRNFWGFGFLGLYVSLFLGAGWKLRSHGRVQWATVMLWLLPVMKEIAQVPVSGRHGTIFGMAYGVLGMAAGCVIGSGLRRGGRSNG